MATGNHPATQIKSILAQVKEQWKQIYPGNPFEYFFLDESFQAQYRAEVQLDHTIALSF